MDTQDSSAAIYSEAKSEYTKQLVYNFQPVLLRFFLDRYAEAKSAVSVTSKTKSALSEFQESLSQIPEWNIDKVQRETSSLLQNVQCDFTEDLITAVFIAHTKILSAIRLNSKPRQKIRITVPKPDHFMHRSLSECSRLLWSNIYLFNDSTTSLDRQKNMNDVNRFLEEGIVQAIRNLLPVKSILRDSLQEDDEDMPVGTSGETGDVTTPVDTVDVPSTAVPSTAIPSTAIPSTALPVEPALPTADDVTPVDEIVSTPSNDTVVENNDVKVISDTRPPKVVSIVKQDDDVKNTLIIDTEKIVGFTGIDSVFGRGDAELKPMVDEASDEFKILGETEELDQNEFEDLDATSQPAAPLSSDDYESL